MYSFLEASQDLVVEDVVFGLNACFLQLLEQYIVGPYHLAGGTIAHTFGENGI